MDKIIFFFTVWRNKKPLVERYFFSEEKIKKYIVTVRDRSAEILCQPVFYQIGIKQMMPCSRRVIM
jgi:hypothetical protein